VRRTSLNAKLSGRNLLLLLACSSFSIFSLLLLLFLLLGVRLMRVLQVRSRATSLWVRAGMAYHRPDLEHCECVFGAGLSQAKH
jgi:hypothetical protein